MAFYTEFESGDSISPINFNFQFPNTYSNARIWEKSSLVLKLLLDLLHLMQRDIVFSDNKRWTF